MGPKSHTALAAPRGMCSKGSSMVTSLPALATAHVLSLATAASRQVQPQSADQVTSWWGVPLAAVLVLGAFGLAFLVVAMPATYIERKEEIKYLARLSWRIFAKVVGSMALNVLVVFIGVSIWITEPRRTRRRPRRTTRL